MNKPECRTCRFRGQGDMTCRRRAPAGSGRGGIPWPVTDDTAWCGEYEAKPCDHEWVDHYIAGPTCTKCGAIKFQWMDRGMADVRI